MPEVDSVARMGFQQQRREVGGARRRRGQARSLWRPDTDPRLHARWCTKRGAGVHAALLWAQKHKPEAKGIVTVPVDGPFFPSNLAERLVGETAALVETENGLQPTYAYWPLGALDALEKLMAKGEPGAVRDFARSIGAAIVRYEDDSHFFNINTLDDYEMISNREDSGDE